jgi:hypothetical protein
LNFCQQEARRPTFVASQFNGPSGMRFRVGQSATDSPVGVRQNEMHSPVCGILREALFEGGDGNAVCAQLYF